VVSGFTSNMTKVSKENVHGSIGEMGEMVNRRNFNEANSLQDGLCTIFTGIRHSRTITTGDKTRVHGGLTERFWNSCVTLLFFFYLSGEGVFRAGFCGFLVLLLPLRCCALLLLCTENSSGVA
jgi:hypothetical protein